MSKSPINFGLMSGVGGLMSSMMSGAYGNMSDQDLDDFSAEMVEHFLDNIARVVILYERKCF